MLYFNRKNTSSGLFFRKNLRFFARNYYRVENYTQMSVYLNK